MCHKSRALTTDRFLLLHPVWDYRNTHTHILVLLHLWAILQSFEAVRTSLKVLTSQNFLNLLVEWVFFCSACTKKNTHIHIYTHKGRFSGSLWIPYCILFFVFFFTKVTESVMLRVKHTYQFELWCCFPVQYEWTCTYFTSE